MRNVTTALDSRLVHHNHYDRVTTPVENMAGECAGPE